MTTNEQAFFARVVQLTRSPEQRHADAVARAASVRGLAIKDWPKDWTLDDIMAVMMESKLSSGEALRQLKEARPDLLFIPAADPPAEPAP